MRVRASDEGAMQHAGDDDVVDKASTSPQQSRILDPANARPDQRWHASFPVLRANR
jgi:hypothetical protein